MLNKQCMIILLMWYIDTPAPCIVHCLALSAKGLLWNASVGIIKQCSQFQVPRNLVHWFNFNTLCDRLGVKYFEKYLNTDTNTQKIWNTKYKYLCPGCIIQILLKTFKNTSVLWSFDLNYTWLFPFKEVERKYISIWYILQINVSIGHRDHLPTK